MSKYQYLNNNGELINSESNYLQDNRAFRYGDGLFETIRIINGRPFKLENHINRLFAGAKVLNFDVPNHYSLDFFRAEIGKLVGGNNIDGGAKVRLHLYRSGDGTYRSETDQIKYILSAEKVNSNLFSINEEGLTVDVYSDIKKERNILSGLKTSNSLLYVMAMNHAKRNNWNEAFILNSNQHIIESSQSNIFLVSNGVLYTPPLSDGCVGGTMRMNLINVALKQNIKVYESSITPQNLLVADEVLLTNAVQGVQWVGAFRAKRYYNRIAKELLNEIVKLEAAVS